MKIYYAHHLWKYDTEIEKYELNLIKTAFPDAEIINPNGDIPHDGEDEESIMCDCLKTVSECDCLVFSSISGVIGKGVHDEALHASAAGKPVFYLNNNQIKEALNIWFGIIGNGENRRTYAVVKVEE